VCVSSSPTHVSDDYVLPTLEHSLSVGAQQFWRQNLCRRRTTTLEQSAAQSQTMWAVIRPVQAVTKDILGLFGSEVTAQCELFLTVQNTNILTYFLSQCTMEQTLRAVLLFWRPSTFYGVSLAIISKLIFITVGGHLLSLVRRCLTDHRSICLMIYEILQSAHRPSDSR